MARGRGGLGCLVIFRTWEGVGDGGSEVLSRRFVDKTGEMPEIDDKGPFHIPALYGSESSSLCSI